MYPKNVKFFDQLNAVPRFCIDGNKLDQHIVAHREIFGKPKIGSSCSLDWLMWGRSSCHRRVFEQGQ